MAIAMPAAAQEVVAPPTPNADRLADEMRVLARDPRNVRALLAAGEYSARLNDPSAAASFFARAQSLDPGNPRLLAGQAMVMVRMERPGEALRLFGEAERRGLSLDAYASDRGLAYDLIGAQPHALRDHRIAMRGQNGVGPDDETIRRYALSLGISGRTQEAMTALDPLLRRTDRASWRARAFILAMNGDAAGADKIAASMMGGFGTALSPFFRRLPTLTAADKAFAVHFGELRRTTARIADAQAAPPLPRIAAEPGVAVAAVQLPPVPVEGREPRRERQTTQRDAGGRGAASRRREREEREREQVAARQAEAQRVADAKAAQERETQRLADLKVQQERDRLAAQQRETERVAAIARDAEARRVADLQERERAATELAAREAETRRVAEAQRVADAQRLADAQRVPVPEPTTPSPEPVARASVPTPGFATPTDPTPTDNPPVQVAEAPPPAPIEPAPMAQASPPPTRVGGEDNVIARIIAGITIPASELGVAPMPGREPVVAPEPEPVQVAQAPAPRPVPVEVVKAPAPKPVVEKPKPDPAVAAKAKAAALKVAEAKAEKAKAAADSKAAAAKLKADPPRHWAQVAGGANVGALPKEWARLVKEAPVEFRGKQAWTTPLRFTNRLLAGPFKTPGEAQAFINLIRKKGLTGFSWTSEAGQKVERLPVK